MDVLKRQTASGKNFSSINFKSEGLYLPDSLKHFPISAKLHCLLPLNHKPKKNYKSGHPRIRTWISLITRCSTCRFNLLTEVACCPAGAFSLLSQRETGLNTGLIRLERRPAPGSRQHAAFRSRLCRHGVVGGERFTIKLDVLRYLLLMKLEKWKTNICVLN